MNTKFARIIAFAKEIQPCGLTEVQGLEWPLAVAQAVDSWHAHVSKQDWLERRGGSFNRFCFTFGRLEMGWIDGSPESVCYYAIFPDLVVKHATQEVRDRLETIAATRIGKRVWMAGDTGFQVSDADIALEVRAMLVNQEWVNDFPWDLD